MGYSKLYSFLNTVSRPTVIKHNDNWRTHFSAAASKTGKQSTLQFKPVAKKPKKNPWSDNESDDVSDGEVEAEEVVAPRERAERKTKGESTRGSWSSLIIRAVCQ